MAKRPSRVSAAVTGKRASARGSKGASGIRKSIADKNEDVEMAKQPDERVVGPAVSPAYRRSVMNVARHFLQERKSVHADTFEPSNPAVESDLGDPPKLSFMKVAMKVTANSARKTSRASRFVTHLKGAVEQSKTEDDEWQKEKVLRQELAADFRKSSVYAGLLGEACELAATLNGLSDSKSGASKETQRLAAHIYDCTGTLDKVHAASLQEELASLRAMEGASICKDLLSQLQQDLDKMISTSEHAYSPLEAMLEAMRTEAADEAGSAEIISRQEKRLRTAEKLTQVAEQMWEELRSFTAEEDDTEDHFLNASISQNGCGIDFQRQATDTSAVEADTAADLQQSRAASRGTARSEEDAAQAALHSNSASHVSDDEKSEKEEIHSVPDLTIIDGTSLTLRSPGDDVIDPFQEITSHAASKDAALPSIQQGKPPRGTPVNWSTHMESLDEKGQREFMMESLSKEEWMLLDSCLSREEKGLKSLRAFYSCLPETELPKQRQSLFELEAEDAYRDAWALIPLTLPAVLYSNDSLRPRSSRNVALHCYKSYISEYASRPASRLSGAASPSPPPSRSMSKYASRPASRLAGAASPSPPPSRNASVATGLSAMAFPEKPHRRRQSLDSLLTQTPLLHTPRKSPVGPCHLQSM